jgi:hypothetical protein
MKINLEKIIWLIVLVSTAAAIIFKLLNFVSFSWWWILSPPFFFIVLYVAVAFIYFVWLRLKRLRKS